MNHKDVLLMIDDFRSMAGQSNNPLEAILLGHRPWREVWQKASEVREALKQTTFPTAAERQAAWDKFNWIHKRAREVADQEWRERAIVSDTKKKDILWEAKRADFIELPLLEATREEMLYRGQSLKEAWRMLREYSSKLVKADRDECYEYLRDLQERHQEWWARFKEHSVRQREYRHDEKKKAFQEKVRGNIDKNEEKLERVENALERAEEYADRLRDQIDGARSDSFREQREEKLEEVMDSIADMKERIALLRQWIAQDEEKLR